MKCSEVEDLIWTHEELSVAQKDALQVHLLECLQCRDVWGRSQTLAHAVAQWRDESPTPENAAQLTHRIMDAVAAQSIHKPRLHWIDVINTAWLRYAMGCVSLILTLGFLYDTVRPMLKAEPVYVSSGQIELKSAAFIENELRQQTKPSFSLMSCIRNQNCLSSFYERKSHDENPQ